MTWRERYGDHQGLGGTMQQPDKDDAKKEPKKEPRHDHHDDANPMPDTHHVNPDADSSDKKE